MLLMWRDWSILQGSPVFRWLRGCPVTWFSAFDAFSTHPLLSHSPFLLLAVYSVTYNDLLCIKPGRKSMRKKRINYFMFISLNWGGPLFWKGGTSYVPQLIATSPTAIKEYRETDTHRHDIDVEVIPCFGFSLSHHHCLHHPIGKNHSVASTPSAPALWPSYH